MGYTPTRKTYRLIFADEEFHGLEITVTTPPMGVLLGAAHLVDFNPANVSKEDLVAIGELFEGLASALVSWNVETPAGEPVPTTTAGFMSQDQEFILAVIEQWVRATTGVSAPLDRRSPGGGSSLAASIPMETLSPNPAS